MQSSTRFVYPLHFFLFAYHISPRLMLCSVANSSTLVVHPSFSTSGSYTFYPFQYFLVQILCIDYQKSSSNLNLHVVLSLIKSVTLISCWAHYKIHVYSLKDWKSYEHARLLGFGVLHLGTAMLLLLYSSLSHSSVTKSFLLVYFLSFSYCDS